MILAEKIVQLRKQVGWSQEELAEKLNVSRQSVSKWESTNSIPDLNKIIMLAETFEVSTDYLLKDDVETSKLVSDGSEHKAIQISLENALQYISNKIKIAHLVTKGVLLCVGSPIPLFAFLAMAKTEEFGLNDDTAAPTGIVFILLMVSFGISFFIRTNQYDSELTTIEKGEFELTYGVRGIIKEKLQKFRSSYNQKLSVGISLFIFAAVPIIFGGTMWQNSNMLMLLIVTIIMVGIGLFLVIPASAEYEAFNRVLQEDEFDKDKSKRTERAEKLAAFYWPLVVAIYIGWSLWTMKWGITWIIWPVAAILFAALVGLMELLEKDER